jgi:cholesterol transport system auxiliary component
MRLFLILCSVLAVSTVIGCAVAPAVNVTAYDFGPNPMRAGVRTRLFGVLTVDRVRAPSWYDGSDILYRLAYQDPTRPQVYRQSRWIASPEELLTQRLRQKLDTVIEGGVTSSDEGVASDYLLRVDLIEFSQVFDTADASHAVVRIRASLIDVKHGQLLAQNDFDAERRAPTPNAAGAVRALQEATDAVLANLANWLIARVKRGQKPG